MRRTKYQPKDGSVGIKLILTDEQEKAKKKALAKSPKHEKLTPVLIETKWGKFTAYYSHDAQERAEKFKERYEEQQKYDMKPTKR